MPTIPSINSYHETTSSGTDSDDGIEPLHVYLNDEYGLNLKESEILASCENKAPNKDSDGICTGLCIRWILHRLKENQFKFENLEVSGQPLEVSKNDRIRGAVVHQLYTQLGHVIANKTSQADSSKSVQSMVTDKTLSSIYGMAGCGIKEVGAFKLNEKGIKQLFELPPGLYHLSCERQAEMRRNFTGSDVMRHAIAIDTRGEKNEYQLLDPNQFVINSTSKSRLFDILEGMTKETGFGARCLRYDSCTAYQVQKN